MLVQRLRFTVLALLTVLPLQTFAAKEGSSGSCILDQFGRKMGTSPQLIDTNGRPLGRGGSGISRGASSALPTGGDLAAYQNGKILVPGGVMHGPVCNQQDAEICWAYVENEFATALLLKATGNLVPTSPDHSGFWHLYSQVFNNPSYFTNLSKRVQSGRLTLEQAIAEAKNFMRYRKGFRATPNTGFQIQAGSEEVIALNEAANFGMTPAADFNRPLSTPQQGQAYDTALTNLVTTLIKSPDRASFFGKVDPDGVNTPLYQTMVSHLQEFYGGTGPDSHPPYRPGDTFVYNGKTYTPGTFMTEVMQFDPSKWAQVTMTQANQTPLLYAVRDSILAGRPVPVGFALYDQPQFQQAPYTLSIDLFNGQRPKLAGGHEMLAVNGTVDPNTNEPLGFNAMNSWGLGIGNDVNGKPTSVQANSGFFGWTVPYFKFTMPVDPPDFVLWADMIGGNSGLMADPVSIVRGKTPRLK